MYPLRGPSPPKKNWGAKFFPNPLGSAAWSKIFLAIVPEEKYPKLVSKFWGLPPKKFVGRVKISPNFMIFRLFCPFLQNGARYRQSKNGSVICGHFSTRWLRNGVLLSSMNYVIRPRRHPPSNLFKLALLGGQGSHSLQFLQVVVGHDV